MLRRPRLFSAPLLGASLLALLAATASLGCAALQPPLTSPAEGGAPWIQLSSRHFLVHTDTEAAEARAALRDFEGIYAAFTDIAFPTDESRARPIEVILFRREKDYLVFGDKLSSGYFVPALPNDIEPTPALVMHGSLVDEARRTFQHELTHHFVRQSLPFAPTWLHEGLAEYYSTFQMAGGWAYVGAPIPGRSFSLEHDRWTRLTTVVGSQLFVPIARLPSVAFLLMADPAVFYPDRGSAEPTREQSQIKAACYAGAWAFIHLLMNGPELYRARFGRYLDAMTHGRRPIHAWNLAFSDLPQHLIEADYHRYMERDLFEPVPRQLHPAAPAPPPSERAMSEAEVHLLWARLRPWKGPELDAAIVDLEVANSAQRALPEVHFWRARMLATQHRLDPARDEILAALRAEPSEPRYLLQRLQIEEEQGALLGASTRPASSLAGLVGELSKVARTATELDAVASYHLARAEADEGMTFAERAMKSDPTCWTCAETGARLHFLRGEVEEAVTVQMRAIAAMPERAFDQRALSVLHRYQEAARSKGP